MSFLDKLKKMRYAGAQLSKEERRQVLEELFVFDKDKQFPFLKHVSYLMFVSTIIACCGLMADSAAVVIGAMLVAPMMLPVMTAAAAITLGWKKYLYRALLLTLSMALGAVFISALFAWASPDLVVIPGQVLARTEPTFFDLVIALAAGSGGAYTMTRRESGAIPGVAMAVALLPPLASTGILLVFHQPELALKAFVLFFTNFAAMVLAGTATFLYVGVPPKKARGRSAKLIRNYLIGFFLLVFGVSVPLYFYSSEVWYDATYKANQSEALQTWLKESELIIDDVQIDEERQILFLKLLGPNPPLNVETLHGEIDKVRRLKTGRTDSFIIEVLWTQTARFSWPPELSLEEDERELALDYSGQYRNKTWYWIGTQYADGDWLRPDQSDHYFLKSNDEFSAEVQTFCAKGRGSYEFNQEELHLVFNTVVSEVCETHDTDQRYVNDLNHVINVNIEDDHMSLRLNNDAGVMYFERHPTDKDSNR